MGDEAKRRVRLYLDHDISYRLAEQLRTRGHDAVGAWEVGNAGLDDPAQLEYAASQGRVLVTCNARDFVPHYIWHGGTLDTITVVSLLLNSWSLGRCCDGWFALSRLSLRRKCGT